jgi:magnesium transporter
MYDVYAAHEGGLRRAEATGGVPASAVWIDMLHPTREEELAVEAALGIEVPTHEEMQEIEISSRLYTEGGALFMTATILSQAATETPEAKPVTFILTGDRLLTIRYSEPKSFQAFISRATRTRSGYFNGECAMVGLLDVIVDRTADTLERLANEVDMLSLDVFANRSARPTKTHDFHDILRRIGRKGDLNSKVRESLVSIGRLTTFVAQRLDARKATKETKAQVKTLIRDVHSLTDHASFLSNKINFLLDATLGMINIEQNAIIKIFSVAAVVFLPPTLVASIYGMNFDFMPELKWLAGYPFALGMMVLSALLPYLYFKRRGWL